MSPKENKFKNKITFVDEIRFQSEHEANRYCKLKLEQRAGLISDLQRQVEYVLEVNGIKICSYFADFVYFEIKSGRRIVEDAKGMKTQIFKLKKKLMLACHGIEILET